MNINIHTALNAIHIICILV